MAPTGEVQSVAGTTVRLHPRSCNWRTFFPGRRHITQAYRRLRSQLGSGAVWEVRYTPLHGCSISQWAHSLVQTTEPRASSFNSGQLLRWTLIGKSGVAYGRFGGLALETNTIPDSPNHRELSRAPSCIPMRIITALTTWTLAAK